MRSNASAIESLAIPQDQLNIPLVFRSQGNPGGLRMAKSAAKIDKRHEEMPPECIADSVPVLPGVDRRTKGGRRMADIMDGISSSLGTLRPEQSFLARRLAALILQADAVDARLARGEPFDGAAYATLTNSILRLYESLGIDTTFPNPDRPERVPSLRSFT
jgi:hypothetical protein